MPGDYQGVTIPLGTLGGMVTDYSPPETPEGVSPDCQDVAFLPGQVFQRPCLSRLFSTPFTDSPRVLYQKTYVQPNEEALNLFIDAANNLWKEDVFNTPGVANLVTQLRCGAIGTAQSCTAFGREYIMCSDGRHGVQVPLQYDGTHLDRVTQDGPGAGVTATEENISFTVAASGVPGLSITTQTQSIVSISESGTLVTVTVGSAYTLPVQLGDNFTIASVSVGGYNGNFALVNISADGKTLQFINPKTGLASSASGTIAISFVNITTTAATTFKVGDMATVAGAGVSGYNTTYTLRFVDPTKTLMSTAATAAQVSLGSSGGGTITPAGQISVGAHQVVVMFLTRQGYITKPSPKFTFQASGNKRVVIASIPLGPPNVVARILAFTGAGGGSFFYIPVTFTLPGTTSTVQSTVINDNTTTTFTVDFSDNALFAATSIDVVGRNYFAQTVLGDCIGSFTYASRMFFWGERSRILNLLNTTLTGGASGEPGVGPFVPLGWTADSTSGGLIGGGGPYLEALMWRMDGDGTTNPKGMLTQPAYQDENNVPILVPNTPYFFRAWALGSDLNLTGNLKLEFYSATGGGVLSAAAIDCSQFSNASGAFFQDQAHRATATLFAPAVIPSDTVIRIYASGLAAGTYVRATEFQIIYAERPYRDNLFRVSYVNAPEQLDGVTGVLGSTNDFTPIRNCFQLRGTAYYNTEIGKEAFTDNGTGEPATWIVNAVSKSVGCVSLHGSDPGRIGDGESGEQWQFTYSDGGLYIFAGGEDMRISQEIWEKTENGFPGLSSINKAGIQNLWIKNDIINRRVLIGAPVFETTIPNILFVLDYRNLDNAAEIVNASPVKSYGGREVVSDTARKWSRWNLSLKCGEILARAENDYQLAVGGSFGNSYTFSSALLTDDDYGGIVPYYVTHFFPSAEKAMELGLDVHRHLATYLSMFIEGTGKTSIIPFVNTLTNAFPALASYPLNNDPTFDYEWGMNVTGERIALKIGSVPNGGTDTGFILQHLDITLKKEPIAPLRGSIY